MQETNYETCYAVIVNSDLAEGRGSPALLYICRLKSTAIRLAEGKNVMGSNGEVKEIQLPRINNTLYRPVNPSEIQYPTFEDQQAEKALQDKRILKAKKEALLEKLKETGYTEEELNLLK